MWTTIIFFFLIIILKDTFKRPLNYPPGPIQFPVIGNLISVWWHLKKLKYHHKVWQRWSQEYGPVIGLRLGFLNVVVVSGREMIKEVSTNEVFGGRPDGFFYTMRSFGKKIGLVFSDGPVWNKTRRAVLRCLKHFGYGSRIMESYISEECRAFVELRLVDAGKPIQVNHMFDVSVSNILWQLIAGKRYDLNDKRLKDLCYLISKSFQVVDMSGGIINFMPFLRHVIPDLIGYTQLKRIHDVLHKFLKETIEEHQQTLDVNNPRDLIDTFLIEMNENININIEESFTGEELQVICLDFLEAGVETVSNTAAFLLLHIVRDQELQHRIRMEIDAEIGQGRPPSLTDRSRMVYTEAVLLEALRIATVAPVGIPHMALNDARLGNYVIPKGTFILLSLYDLHNGEHWKTPTTFWPERFLTKDGNLIQDDWLMPFGSGRRRCIGEGLARSELFLFLTYILQKFYIKVPEGDPLPTLEPVNGVTLSPKDFRIMFIPREI